MTTIALTLLSLGLLAALLYRDRANDSERQKLLDRIQSPQAAAIAALERADPRDHHVNPDEWEPVAPDGDLALYDLIDRHDGIGAS